MVTTPCDDCRKAPGTHPIEDGNVFLCSKCFAIYEHIEVQRDSGIGEVEWPSSDREYIDDEQRREAGR